MAPLMPAAALVWRNHRSCSRVPLSMRALIIGLVFLNRASECAASGAPSIGLRGYQGHEATQTGHRSQGGRELHEDQHIVAASPTVRLVWWRVPGLRPLHDSERGVYGLPHTPTGPLGGGGLNCSEARDCSECVAVGCLWCPDDSSCLKQDAALQTCPNADNQCPNYVYVYVIWLVLSVMLCLCCLTCTTRRCVQEWRVRLGQRSSMSLLGRDDASLYERLLHHADVDAEQEQREAVWRNSLQEDGEEEWQCPVCALHNRPRARVCPLCSTSYDQALALKGLAVGGPVAAAAKATHDSNSTQAGDKKTAKSEGEEGQGEEALTALTLTQLRQLSSRQKKGRRRRLWQLTHTTDGLVWVRRPLPSILTPLPSPAPGPLHELYPELEPELAPSLQPAVHVSCPCLHEEGAFTWTPVTDPPLPTPTQPDETPQPPHDDKERDQAKEPLEEEEAEASGDASAALLPPVPPSSAVPVPPPVPSDTAAGGGSARRRRRRRQALGVGEGAEGLSGPTLVGVSGLPFRRKHLWLVEQLAKRVQLPWSQGHIRLDVRRSHLLEDSFAQVLSLQALELRQWMRVQFVGEPGVDAGGLEREWFILVTQALFDPALGLFIRLPHGAYAIAPCSLQPLQAAAVRRAMLGEQGQAEEEGGALDREVVLQSYYLVGRVLGKALLEHQTLPLHPCLCLLKHMLGQPLGLGDLEWDDEALHRSLTWLRDKSNVQLLHLDFTLTQGGGEGGGGEVEVIELMEGGAEVGVDEANKDHYLTLRLDHHLLHSQAPQLWQMLRGLYEVVPRSLLSVLDPCELELLLCGLPVVDVGDWKRHTEYLGHYHRLGERHHVIRWFWEVVGAMSEDERVRLLQFTTGACTVPAQGFKALQSNDGNFRMFNIQSVRRQECLFPRAHTCFNKLDLPLFASKEELEYSLRMVINSPFEGFSIE